MNRENAWTTYEEADIKALEGLCKEYKDFLSMERQNVNV